MFALSINASILILAAATFHARADRRRGTRRGACAAPAAPRRRDRADPVRHRAALLRPELHGDGDHGRPDRHGGLPRFRLPPWLRRLVTRGIAIVPAAAVTIAYGESGTAKLLILSQVILSLQLPFAVIPLVTLTASREKMGDARRAALAHRASPALIAAIIVALNVKLLVDFVLG